MTDLFETRLEDVVGGRTAKKLAAAFEHRTVRDLLWTAPRTLLENGKTSNLIDLVDGESVVVSAKVQSVSSRKMRDKPGHITEIVIGDAALGRVSVTFFDAKPFRARMVNVGDFGVFSGKVSTYNGRRQLVGPRYTLLRADGAIGSAENQLSPEVALLTGAFIPIYAATKDIDAWAIAQSVTLALEHIGGAEDPLPARFRAEHGLMGIVEGMQAVHRPTSYGHWIAGKRRFAWDEALALQFVLARRREANSLIPTMPRPRTPGRLLDAFDQRLPFALTAGQREIGDGIAAELLGPAPMQRLLQGEVGSGKTVVALRAMLQVVDAGGQAALLAPTEVLAAQHLRTIQALMGDLAREGQFGASEHATRIALLTGSQTAGQRRAALLEAASGAAGIVVGTHAVIQENVQFADLALVVVDEQHRFGVEQRDALRAKAGTPPHLLAMTATPIPRPVAMTVFGDLDASTLRELPVGRSPIATSVVPADNAKWVDRTWTRVREEVAAGRQVFVVCPRIGLADGPDTDTLPEDEPDDIDEPDDARPGADGTAKVIRPPLAVLDVAAHLREGPLAGLRLGILHGRLPAGEKDAVMEQVTAGDLDVLVATTVIEVGVDVPNATVMVVMDAHRFGMSQLHQLRGRIGRGAHAGLCLLVTDSQPGTPGRERLDAVAGTSDGFVLAQLDLAQRREGDVLGAAQSGRATTLRFLSILTDEDVISAARLEAQRLVAEDRSLRGAPNLRAHIEHVVREQAAEFLEKT
ncbi:MAG: ATP-dependent helicase RecG [Pseudonocardiales bacterium]|nr:ATP-dependent helicase RecG [Pseudonocardiales bacterium]